MKETNLWLKEYYLSGIGELGIVLSQEVEESRENCL